MFHYCVFMCALPRNDLLCVERDVKPLLTHSTPPPPVPAVFEYNPGQFLMYYHCSLIKLICIFVVQLAFFCLKC